MVMLNDLDRHCIADGTARRPRACRPLSDEGDAMTSCTSSQIRAVRG